VAKSTVYLPVPVFQFLALTSLVERTVDEMADKIQFLNEAYQAKSRKIGRLSGENGTEELEGQLQQLER